MEQRLSGFYNNLTVKQSLKLFHVSPPHIPLAYCGTADVLSYFKATKASFTGNLGCTNHVQAW